MRVRMTHDQYLNEPANQATSDTLGHIIRTSA